MPISMKATNLSVDWWVRMGYLIERRFYHLEKAVYFMKPISYHISIFTEICWKGDIDFFLLCNQEIP